MFTLTIPEEMIEKLRVMIEEEGDDMCARIREYKHGKACSAKIILGFAIDEFDEDEDEKQEISGLPFIIEEDLIVKYGREFKAEFNDKKEVVLTAVGGE